MRVAISDGCLEPQCGSEFGRGVRGPGGVTWWRYVRLVGMRFLMGAVCGFVLAVGIQVAPRSEKRDMNVDLAEYHVKEMWRRFFQVDPKDDSAFLVSRKDLGSAEVFFLESKLHHDRPVEAGMLDGELYMKLVRSKELPSLVSGHANNSAPDMEMDKAALKEADKAYAGALKANQKYLDELDKAIKIGFKPKNPPRS